MKRSLITLFILTAVIVVCAACGKAPSAPEKPSGSETEEIPEAQRDIFAMDTYMTIKCYGERCEEAADAAVSEIERLDRLLSVGNPDSEVSRINKEKEGTLSEDSRIMTEKSLQIFESTDGAFDITVYPLMVLWGFTSGEYAVPEEKELQSTLKNVGSEKLQYEKGTLRLSEGQGIDLGGIAKGYTSDRLMQIFEEYDLVSAMISLGGNVQLFRTKPDGSLWKCGIQDPNREEESTSLMGVLQAADCAVITSGAYERFFVDDKGTTYHHIVDPKNGYPANNGLKSVTIVSPEGILADGLSTTCYVMGLERSSAYWKNSKEAFDMILMTDDNEVYVTEGIAEQFSTEYPVTVIRK